MPKQSFGGDDDVEIIKEEKPPSLDRYGLSPDTNIRDMFWKIMESYSSTKKPGIDLSILEKDRFALMRVAVSILSQNQSEQYGLMPKTITALTIQMMIDGKWQDAFSEFLGLALNKKHNIKNYVMAILKKINVKDISEILSAMLRDGNNSSIALEIIAEIENKELNQELKKELIIFARGDIGLNQKNAIKAISMLDDDEVKKSFLILLSHWDSDARLEAAKALKKMNDPKVKAEIQKKMHSETNSEIRAILEEIVSE